MNLASKLGAAALAAALTAGVTFPASFAGNAAVERKAAYKPNAQGQRADRRCQEEARAVRQGAARHEGCCRRPAEARRSLEEWKTEARLKTSKKGTFTYTDKPNRTGVRYYRAVVPKAGRVKGKSKPVKVTVASWRSLADIPFRQTESTAVVWSGTSIAGKAYAPSVVALPDAVQGKADWNVPATCTTLRVRLGNGDQTDLGAFATITLDGGPGGFVHTKAYGPEASELKTFDVSDVFRLTYTWKSTVSGSDEPAAGAQPLLAQPELLCS